MDESQYSGFACSEITGKRHDINHLTPASEWCQVYQIEHHDEAKGGEFGLANLQAQALTNRTEYLYNSLINLQRGISDLYDLLTQSGDIKTKKTLPFKVATEINDSVSAFLQVDQAVEDGLFLSLESGEIYLMDSGDVSLDTGSIVYNFNNSVTVPSSDDTLDGVDPLDQEFNDTITDQDISDLLAEVYGYKFEDTTDSDIVSLVSDIYNN